MITRQSLSDRWTRRVLKRSALNLRGGEDIIRTVLQEGNFKHMLEIGTYRGWTAVFASQYVGKVSTIDLKYGRLEYCIDAGTEVKEPTRTQLLQEYDIQNVDIYLMDDNSEKQAIISSLDFDFAFIDGAHDESVKDDFEMVKHCGNVLFHDYDDSGVAHKNKVYDFINTLPKEQLTVMDIFAYWRA